MNLLSLSSVLSTIGYVIVALLILLAMITVHEFGHYIVGKIFKFKINEFSIGMGPLARFPKWDKQKRKIVFKKTQWKLKSGELFSIRWFPLGGYCAFDGEDGESTENKEEDKKDVFEDAQKELEKDNEITESFVSQTEVNLDRKNIEKKTEKDNSGMFTSKPPWQRILVLLAGATMNYLLAMLVIITSFSIYGQQFYVVNSVNREVDNYAIYSEYSFEDGDIISKVNGHVIYSTTDFMSALKNKSQGDIVKVCVYRQNEEGKLVSEEVLIKLRDDAKIANLTDTSTVFKVFGFGIVERDGVRYYDVSSTNVRLNFFETIGHSFGYANSMATTIFKVLGQLLTGVIRLDDAAGGTVATIVVTAKVASMGFENFLYIIGLIGVNLAVMNLLPIPALDGSRIVFSLIEWIFKKPVNRKVEAIIHTVGLILLLSFSVLVDLMYFI